MASTAPFPHHYRVQLDGDGKLSSAEGTIQAVAKRTTLTEYPLQITDGMAHVQALSTALASFGKSVRHGIVQATELRDADTANLFTEVSRDVDKYLWFVEAHLQK